MKGGLVARQVAWQCQNCRNPSSWKKSLSIRSFSSTLRTRDEDVQQQGPIKAAPPIDFEEMEKKQENERMKHARLIPASPSYFTAKPEFVDASLELQALLRKYQSVPTVTAAAAPRAAWKKLADFRNSVGEPVKAAKYKSIILLLRRLNRIHPALMPPEVAETLRKHKREIDPGAVVRKIEVVDEFGRAKGIGRRKSSSAKVQLVEGEGEVLINGKSINTVFGRVHDRESALWALKSTGRMDKYNVWALVSGGGTTGQAEAITLGVAKALLVHEPALKPALRRAGCLTRDPRKVERKKPGRLKARKMPTWVKR